MRLPALAFLFAAACSSAESAAPPAPAAALAPSGAMFALQTRDYKVTVLHGDKVRVEDARGALVADGVTLAQLEAVDPFLYAACVNAVAGKGPYLDARLDRPQLQKAETLRPR